MSTKNHKPATTSDILTNPQIQQSGPPSTPDTRPSFPSSPSTLDTQPSSASNNPFPTSATRARFERIERNLNLM